MSSFTLATFDEVLNAILSASNATCSLDFIPTCFLKSCLNTLLQPISALVNLSLAEGLFPDNFKHAIVTPLYKKHSLPHDELSSFRPISNLNIFSKILERIIHSRHKTHLNTFPSLSRFQSAYLKFHSTEIALKLCIRGRAVVLNVATTDPSNFTLHSRQDFFADSA